MDKLERDMNRANLVFLPAPGISHLVPTVELGKFLINRCDKLSITFLIIQTPFANDTTRNYIDSVAASTTRIQFIDLPHPNPTSIQSNSPDTLSLFIQNHKPSVKHTLTKLTNNSVKLVGFVVDLFSTPMIDVANEIGIPAYLFYTASAAALGLMLHLPTLRSQIPTNLIDYVGELTIPSLINPVPPSALPASFWYRKGEESWLIKHTGYFRETKGIIVNSFTELESQAMNSFTADHNNGTVPPVYPVGPLINFDSSSNADHDKIIKWLDDQPSSSVIFLCFGSVCTFGKSQVKEIAFGLERSGHRFLWSLRLPSDYTTLEEILPDGFLKRMKGRGFVCGWAPQVAVLAHKAIGAFVSHCGWNSTLESLWFGVPIVAWPLQAEQKLNAFELVKDLGLAVEIRSVDHKNSDDLVTAEEIDRALRFVMGGDNEVRKKVKEMKEKSRKARMNGGSSFSSVGCLIEDLIKRV